MLRRLIYIEQGLLNVLHRFKGRLLTTYLKMHGCKVGKGLKCIHLPTFRLIPFRNIQLGKAITLGENITIEVVKGASLIIGDRTNITRNISLVANESIQIGENCLIGENVSIRDADHGTISDYPMNVQQPTSEPIVIGNDVWIGAGTIIIKGCNVPDGCVIGAHSLVVKSSELVPYGIYGGNPLKLIRMRGRKD